MDYLKMYKSCKDFSAFCLLNGSPCDMAMLGWIDNVMEMDILEELIMEFGRS
jgi:hypothetical protein